MDGTKCTPTFIHECPGTTYYELAPDTSHIFPSFILESSLHDFPYHSPSSIDIRITLVSQQDSTTEEEGSRQFERHDSNKLLVIHEQLSSISSASVVLVLECLM